MARKPSIDHLRRGATELTNEAGTLIRDYALNAAHQTLVLALQSVQAADRKLGHKGERRRSVAPRRARPTAKVRRRVTTAQRGKPLRRGRRATR